LSDGGSVGRYAGDILVVLDKNLQVVWTWDTFDHLDEARRLCSANSAQVRPAPSQRSRLAARKRHQLVAIRRHLLISVRHQDWVSKIEYAHGRGDGHLIWPGSRSVQREISTLSVSLEENRARARDLAGKTMRDWQAARRRRRSAARRRAPCDDLRTQCFTLEIK
jgi:Arylsulfotransferase (ASST)